MHNTEDIYDVSASLSAVCRYLRGGQFKRLQVCLIECTNTCFPVFWLRKKEREKEKRYPPPVSLLVFAWMTMDNYDETDFGHGRRYWYLRESMAMGWMTETRRRIWSRLTQLCRWDGTSSLLFSPPASFLGLDN